MSKAKTDFLMKFGASVIVGAFMGFLMIATLMMIIQ